MSRKEVLSFTTKMELPYVRDLLTTKMELPYVRDLSAGAAAAREGRGASSTARTTSAR